MGERDQPGGDAPASMDMREAAAVDHRAEVGDGPKGAGARKHVRNRVSAAQRRVDSEYQHLQAIRSQVAPVDVAFRVHEDDRAHGGSLLGGAIAFRVFLWLLPAVLLVVAGLGFESSNPNDANRVVRDFGLTSIAANTINDAAHQASHGRWFALILGVIFLYTTSVALVKALHVAHHLVWRTLSVKIDRKPRAVAELLGFAVAILAATSLASVIRQHSPGLGLLAMLAVVVIYAGAWWVYSMRLPHGDASAVELIPGAIVFGLGCQALHLVSVYYLAARVSHASVLYGSLGAAAALLFGLYLLGRLIIGSAVVNAALWERNHHNQPASPPAAGSEPKFSASE
jgi:uncharacterized BrkB/YihY/UPF0761 family membrane protein